MLFIHAVGRHSECSLEAMYNKPFESDSGELRDPSRLKGGVKDPCYDFVYIILLKTLRYPFETCSFNKAVFMAKTML
jgi:hypothetical protein